VLFFSFIQQRAFLYLQIYFLFVCLNSNKITTANSGKSGLRQIQTPANPELRIMFFVPSENNTKSMHSTPANPELRQIRTHLLVPSSKNHCFYSGKPGQQRKTCQLNENFITRLLFVFNTFLLDH